MIAPATAPVSLEVHHGVPRCLLRLRDRADAAGFTGEGIELALEFEHEARCWGVDPEVSRDELAAMIDYSTVEIPEQEHRETHAEDFARRGRRGGLATLKLYGPAWFVLLARRRWEKIGAEALAEHMAGRS
jgi:hypothetical protein